MQKILGILVLIVLIGGGYYVLTNTERSEPLPGTGQEEIVSPLALYFGQELTKPESPDGPIPIEGYDANLLLGRYSGFVEEDFEAVDALQGVYTMVEDELTFVLEAENEHSAARTIAPSGYETLLENLSDRLGLEINTEADIDQLITTLSGE